MTVRLIALIVLIGCGHVLAQKVTPAPFRLVNSPYDEQAPVISPDGKTMYLTIANHPQNIGGKRDAGDIWVSLFMDGQWQPPIHAGQALNNAGYNAVAGFSADGSTLFLLGHYEKNGEIARTQGISFCRKNESGWTSPENISIPYFLNRSDHFSGMISKDGNTFVFAAESYGTRGVEDIYVSLKKDGRWSDAINLGSVINTPYQEWTPALSDDGRTLFFSSNGRKGLGGFDIFMSIRLDDSWTNWSEPVNVGEPRNSEARDLYFRSDATPSVFTTTRDSDRYGNIFAWYDSAHTVKMDTIKMVEKKYPSKGAFKKVTIYGLVTSAKAGNKLNARLYFKTDSLQLQAVSADGKFQIIIPSTKIYHIEIQSPGFVNLSEKLDIHTYELQTLEMNFKLQPIEVGTVVNLKNILFVVGTTTLLAESYPELDVVQSFLLNNPNVEIMLEGHTDNRGNAEANLILSRQRVEVIKKYLVSKGIPAKRIKGKGYGGTKPVTTADNEEARKLNRRVEFVIVKD
ncbi:MAG: OmpA family protein [Bacteroidetes bacterium]|nr:OmpA family protein [Bacteroidota bacterium]MBS1541627.1 OmpA family protein [Bacteroidota bacterium]